MLRGALRPCTTHIAALPNNEFLSNQMKQYQYTSSLGDTCEERSSSWRCFRHKILDTSQNIFWLSCSYSRKEIFGIFAITNIPHQFGNSSGILVFRKENNETGEIAHLILSGKELSDKEADKLKVNSLLYPVQYSIGFGNPLGKRLTLHYHRVVDGEIAISPSKNATKNRRQPVVFLWADSQRCICYNLQSPFYLHVLCWCNVLDMTALSEGN